MSGLLATRKDSATRDRLLDLAEAAILQKGFAATSIEELVAGAEISRSGFFYHFKDKGQLARALLLRYVERDRAILDDIFARGDALNDDPLHGFLVGLRLFAEMTAALPEAHPGCLVAAICYQEQLFDREIRAINRDAVLAWRTRFRARFDAIVPLYPPRIGRSRRPRGHGLRHRGWRHHAVEDTARAAAALAAGDALPRLHPRGVPGRLRTAASPAAGLVSGVPRRQSAAAPAMEAWASATVAKPSA